MEPSYLYLSINMIYKNYVYMSILLLVEEIESLSLSISFFAITLPTHFVTGQT